MIIAGFSAMISDPRDAGTRSRPNMKKRLYAATPVAPSSVTPSHCPRESRGRPRSRQATNASNATLATR